MRTSKAGQFQSQGSLQPPKSARFGLALNPDRGPGNGNRFPYLTPANDLWLAAGKELGLNKTTVLETLLREKPHPLA